MKKMKLLFGFLLLTLIACGQNKSDTFQKPMYFNYGITTTRITFTDGTFMTTKPITGTGMVYPSAGIPVSTGTAWAGSITNNSAHWDLGYQAYLWGNHSGLYKLLNAKVDYVTEVINKPGEIELIDALKSLPGGVPILILTQAQINALVIPAGESRLVVNSTDGILQYWTGSGWKGFPTVN
jgi:hypothetical protein